MTLELQIVAVSIGGALFVGIIELVRRRKLREEYAWLWMLTGLMIVVLSVWYDLLVFISRLLGRILPSSILFLFGMLFLLLISLHQSIKISKLTDQLKTLAQELAIMEMKGKGNEEGTEK